MKVDIVLRKNKEIGSKEPQIRQTLGFTQEV